MDRGNEQPKPRETVRQREQKAQRRRKLAGVAGTAAALALVGGIAVEMNQPVQYVPNEVETGPVTITADANLRTEPLIPDQTSAEEGDANNSLPRENLTLQGHALENQSFLVKNFLIVTMPSGEKWGVLRGVKEEDKPQTFPLYVDLKDKGLQHPLINSFAEIQPDGSARTEGTGTVIPKDEFEQIEFTK